MVGFELNPSILLELNGLHDQLKEKEREMGVASTEIKALRAKDILKDKALEQMRKELDKSDEKLRITEKLLEQKTLETTRFKNEKKLAVAAQYAAESALRRLHSNHKEDESSHLDSIVAPLEANLKFHKNEIAALQEDKKALERISKSKESALLEAEKILTSALERALIVEEVQNHNFELKRRIEICQEENRILDKTNRQKVLEVEKLSKTIIELEEAVLAGGAAANMVRDYKRQTLELQEEKRTLERELARAKVSATRAATAVASEWKNENEKVMPIKQWLDERKLLQAEMQRTREKLAVSERAAKAEAQLKDKFKLRLKTLEDGLKLVPNPIVSANTNASYGYMTPKTEKGVPRKRCSSQPRGGRSSPLQRPNTENDDKVVGQDGAEEDDVVSGYLYDRIQREVIGLMKSCEAKESSLIAKDEEIKSLMKKVDTLTKAMEVEARRVKRETTLKEKEALQAKAEETKKIRNSPFLK